MPNETICKHTPGPWKIGTFKGIINGDVHDALSIWPADAELGNFGRHVCLVSALAEVDERSEADAHLIAAAPEQHSWMWTALTALRYWRDSETNKDKYAELCKIISDGEDIYRKAEGR